MSKDLWLAGMVFVFIMTVVICTYKYNMKKLDSPSSSTENVITSEPTYQATVDQEKPVKKARMWQ